MVPGEWTRTPRWMFWKQDYRRANWISDGAVWTAVWEYQHPAFIAREALQRRFDHDDK